MYDERFEIPPVGRRFGTRAERYRKLRKKHPTVPAVYLYGWVIGQDRARKTHQQALALDGAGLLEMRIAPDDDCDFDFLAGDCMTPEELGDFRERVNREGVWGIICNVRTSPKERWTEADSCWGFVGDDVYECWIDVATEGIRRLREMLQGRCPCCRRAWK